MTQCGIDHSAIEAVPTALCRMCHPCVPVTTTVPSSNVGTKELTHARDHRRRDLPKNMTPEAWTILQAQERTAAEKKTAALAKLKEQRDATRAELGDEAYKALQRSKRRAKLASKPKQRRKRRK